jgi:hypothetical protein
MTRSFVDGVDSRYPAEGGSNPSAGTQEAAPPPGVASALIGGQATRRRPAIAQRHASFVSGAAGGLVADAVRRNSMAAEEVGGAR